MQRPEPETDQTLDLNSYLVILFRMFRHRKIILIPSVIGLAAAAVVFFLAEAEYESRAKLLVRYVVERSAIDAVDSQADFRGSEGQKVINAEVEILTSEDLAVETSEALNADKPSEEHVYPYEIIGGLSVSASPAANIIWVSFKHTNPGTAMRVLEELVERYLYKHLEIHRSAGTFEYVRQQTDQVRSRLMLIEDELGTLKADAGIVSIEDSSKSLSERMAKLQMDLLAAETESAEQRARLDALEKLGGGGGDAEARGVALNTPGEEEIEKYQTLVELLAEFRKKKLTLLMEYTPEHRLVKINDRQIAEAETRRDELTAQYPGLVLSSSPDSPLDLISEKARLAAIDIRMDILEEQVESLKLEARRLAENGRRITELERRKAAEEEKYLYFESKLEKARIDEALDPANANISTVQSPSAAIPVASNMVKKLTFLLAAGGIGIGFGLAFLIEQILDRRIKQPLDLTRMRIPLMLSIPHVSGNGHAEVLALPGGDDDGEPGEPPQAVSALAVQGPNGSAPSPWETTHFVRPYSEAIRDRLSCYFELNNMTHKPKLVALTGFSKGSGTTTLSIGLASAFSEIGDGKVLLVDMNPSRAEAHPFFKGKPACQLTEALDFTNDEFHMEPAEDNLYLAKANDGTRLLAPKKLYELIPQFKASEFDYIIFDMPPLGPTSPTLAMAGFMDKVLLVVDGDKTSRDRLKRGHAELVAAKADVSCLFNKARSYIPSWLQDQI